MRDLGIADRLRRRGLVVVEVDGWRSRGSATFNPRGVVDHHTAGARVGNAPSLGICINGRKRLPGPLCNVLTARDGTVYVIAAGRANHAGEGTWRGLRGNSSMYGNERENAGTSAEPWSAEQTRVAAAVNAALLEGVSTYGARPDPANVCEHKEWAPKRKPDAHTITGDEMRSLVARALDAGGVGAGDPEEDDDMVTITADPDRNEVAIPLLGGERSVVLACDFEPARVRLAIGRQHPVGEWQGPIESFQLEPARPATRSIPPDSWIVSVVHEGGRPVTVRLAR